ncbi:MULTISPECIES: alpha-2-macroglobulin [unclassified Meiothermus]|uniref:alpha-2-macroglobulin family protein n=1 Tax=unclassified Meiothermus TaxID=370471 RepID=UPI000D7C0114|nr:MULTISPECIES: MG2 domain-containing protein [unclassified Meiothermus]PZA06961.1 hypothetical protein DNA98_09820 [Meiothermus sp. Pnk-1]RYM38350.1 hypothetical protein EWH23_04905 [Meiothermus sp. PNK-Is4]
MKHFLQGILWTLLVLPVFAQSGTRMELYGGGVKSPQEPVALEYYIQRPQSTRLELFRLYEPEKLLALYGPRGVRVEGLERLKKTRLRVIPVYPGGSAYGTIRIGRLPPGLYYARIGGGLGRTLILVTRLGLVVKAEPGQTLTYTADLASGKPRAARIYLLERGVARQATADASGIARLPSPAHGDGAVVAARYGMDWAFSRLFWNGWSLVKNRVYLVTDRPVYRPGHPVFFKGIARSAAGLKPRAGQRLEVRVVNSDDEEIFQQTFTTDAYGSFSGEFRLGLDAPLGDYRLEARLEGETHDTSFEVQEFVKPEYQVSVTPSRPTAIQGDQVRFTVKGEYLFEGPVAGGKVQWSLLRSPYYRYDQGLPYEFYGDAEEAYGDVIQRGEGTLNERGELVVEVPLERQDDDYRLSLQASVSDETQREQRGAASLVAYRAGIVLGLETDRYAYQSGDSLLLNVRAEDLQGRPVAVPFTLVAEREFWVRSKGVRREQVSARQGQTNARGEATLHLSFSAQGSYRFTLSAKDPQGRPTREQAYVWVSGDSYWFWGYEGLTVRSDKKVYKPGEEAVFVIQSPVENGYALVTLEGQSLRKAEVVKMNGSALTYRLKVTEAMGPNSYLSVSVIGKGDYYQGEAEFLVPPEQRFLNVAIRPSAESFKPQDTATYTLRVTDASGKPVKAQVTVGLVDEAIYLVRPENTPDIRGFFYPRQSNVVGTELASGYSFGFDSGRLSGRPPMSRAVFAQAKEGLATARLRSDFRDTILWLPAVETDETGEASLEVKFPDNLTQWRLTARAITLGQEVGQGRNLVRTTLPVIARIAAPRFLVRGDEARVRVIGQNNLGQNLRGRLNLEAEGLTNPNPGGKSVTLSAGGRSSAEYTVQARQTGSAKLKGSVLTPSTSDALEVTLPVIPKGVRDEIGWAAQVKPLQQPGDAGTQGSARWSFTLPDGVDPGSVQGALILTPSLTAAVAPALRYLAGYPYGCSEQTMSRFLPSVLAKRSGGSALLPEEITANLDEMVEQGLARLYRFQHEDGGWGFWENDDSSLFISAYVMGGLLEARAAGYRVRERVLEGGFKYLQDYARRTDVSADARAMAYFTLAQGGKGINGISGVLADKNLTPYGLAQAVLALAEAGQQDQALATQNRLLAKVTERASLAYWESGAPDYGWNDDRVETTAYALMGLARLRPDHPIVPKVVNWLLLERRGSAWRSSKDTAAVVRAALELSKRQSSAEAWREVRISVDGQEVATQTVGEAASASVPILNLSAGTHVLEVGVSGEAPLYLGARLSYVSERAYNRPEGRGLRVARQFERLVPKYLEDQGRYVYGRSPLTGPVRPGELVLVTISVTPQTKGALRYLLVEDGIPAGFSAVEEAGMEIEGVDTPYGSDYYGWNYGYDGREFRDQRAEFYFSYLDRPITFSYVLRAETPGRYSALPTVAWLMYDPEVRGVGTEREVRVGE